MSSIEQLCQGQPEWEKHCEQLQSASTLSQMVQIGLQMGLFLARKLIEQELEQRAQQPMNWDNCSLCGTKLQSKGWQSRKMETLVGKIEWQRRVGRCRKGCPKSLSIPLDEAIGIKPHQSGSEELMRLGCLLSIIMPYELASWILGQWSGLSISASTLWNWVQIKGQEAQADLEAQLQAQASGEECEIEFLEASLATLSLAISADGVMVPFRPTPHSPKGKTLWQEIKVGILARLGSRISKAGERLPQLLHHRVVAVLGNIDEFIPRIRLEARKQSFESAPGVIWLSDGGRGFWRSNCNYENDYYSQAKAR